jgi:hypothetical protein
MKKYFVFSLIVSAAGMLMAADSSPKTDVLNAAAALGGADNYAWHSAATSPNGGRFNGTTDGKTQKDGYTWLSLVRGDNTILAVIKGTNGAINTTDNGWQSLQEATADNGGGGFNPAMFIARMVSNYKTPAAQAVDLANQAKELTAGTNGISGDLTDDGAKAQLTFRGGRGNGDGGPTVSDAKGSVTFWVTDGKLVKYQFHVTGTVSFNGNDRDVDRTTTVEIKDVGTTKIDVPDEAKKKLE